MCLSVQFVIFISCRAPSVSNEYFNIWGGGGANDSHILVYGQPGPNYI